MWRVFKSVVINPNMKEDRCYLDHDVHLSNGQLILEECSFKENG